MQASLLVGHPSLESEGQPVNHQGPSITLETATIRKLGTNPDAQVRACAPVACDHRPTRQNPIRHPAGLVIAPTVSFFCAYADDGNSMDPSKVRWCLVFCAAVCGYSACEPVVCVSTVY